MGHGGFRESFSWRAVKKTHFHDAEKSAFTLLLGASFTIPFTMPVSRALLTLSLALLTFHLIKHRRPPVLGVLFWLAICFVVATVAATVFGVNPELGVPKLRKLIWLIALPVTATLMNSPARLVSFLYAFSAGAVVMAFKTFYRVPLAAAESFKSGDHSHYLTALMQSGGMTNGQRLMLGVVVSLGLYSLWRKRKKGAWKWLVAMAIQAGGLIMNFKRGSWFTTAALVVVFAAMKRNWKLLALLILALCAILSLPPVRERISQTRNEFRQNKGGRLAMWTKAAPILIRDNPFGVGYRSLTNEMMREIAHRIERGRDHLHSNIPQVLVATGWPGFAIYSTWMITALAQAIVLLRRSANGPPEAATGALVVLLMFLGLLGNGLVEYNFGDSELFMVYAFLMGCIAGGVSRHPSRTKPV